MKKFRSELSYTLLFLLIINFIPHKADAQSILLNLDPGKDINPIPDEMQCIISSGDIVTDTSYSIKNAEEEYSIRNAFRGNYKIHVKLRTGKTDLLEGFGRFSVEDQDTVFLRIYPSIVNDTTYLLIDSYNKKSTAKGASTQFTMIDTTGIKTYPIHNPDSLADVWLARDMPTYIYQDVMFETLDTSLVPLTEYTFGTFRNPVTIGMTAYFFYEDLLRTNDPENDRGFINNARWLVENHDSNFYYHYGFDYSHSGRKLAKGWVSGMAQGHALGVLSLAYHHTGDPAYFKTAEGVLKTLYGNAGNDWCVVTDEKNYYWIEEYPNQDTCHVLNGKVTALFGLWQYYIISRDSLALKLFEAGIRTLADNWAIWNINGSNRSYYCEHHSEYRTYHLKHLHQLRFFGEFFGVPELVNASKAFSANVFSVYPESRNISHENGMTTFHIFNADDWTFSTNYDWITLDSLDQNTIQIDYQPNPLSSERKSSVQIKNTALGTIISPEMTQKSKPFLNIGEPDSLILPWNQSQLSIGILSNLRWVMTFDTSWFSTSIIGDSIKFLFEENCNQYEKQSKIKFTTCITDLNKNIHLEQASAPFFLVEPDSIIIPETSDTIIIPVHPVSGWTVLNDSEWLTSINQADTVLMIIYSTNQDTMVRQVSIYLTPGNGCLSDSLRIIQNGTVIPHQFPSTISAIRVFPNPAKHWLNIQSDQLYSGTINIYSISGTKIYSEPLAPVQARRIDISKFPAGIYILQINTSKFSSVHRLIIEH